MKPEEFEDICDELQSGSNILTKKWTNLGNDSLNAEFNDVALVCFLITDNQNIENDSR